MVTATSSATALALAAALAISSGCGGARQSARAVRPTDAGFAAVRAGAPPVGWRALRIPSGAVLFYPPGWTAARGDAGTATAVFQSAGRRVLGYLNLTPRQGEESLTTWPAFRLAHNAREGDREVQGEASAHDVRFRTGAGSCVRDRYTTISGAHYIELACLVQGATTASVIVAASSPGAWTHLSPQLYRALSALTT